MKWRSSWVGVEMELGVELELGNAAGEADEGVWMRELDGRWSQNIE